MLKQESRRNFLLKSISGTSVLGLGDLSFLSGLTPVSAEEAKLDPDMVQLKPDIEPLVRLLEDTPRDQLLEEVGVKLKKGLPYQQLLASLLLAGVRNVQPRPSVGFKFHAVLVVNSAHLASLASPDSDRWLPIFWALDYFKDSQARDESQGNWTLKAVDESTLPAAHNARQAFIDAMNNWDEEAANRAVTSLARMAGAQELFELFCRYGARDYRSIGHKAIFVANSWRTLQCIGWRHAEPVLRSLAYALLNHEGGNPAERDARADRPWRHNQKLAEQINDHWQEGEISHAATVEMLTALRNMDEIEICSKVVELLNKNVSPQSIWDAIFTGAMELLMSQPGIVALHAVTTTNALYFAYQHCHDEKTRRLMLLQNAAFLPMFKHSMGNRGNIRDRLISDLSKENAKKEKNQNIESIFHELSHNRLSAAQQAYQYLKSGHQPRALIDAARLLIFQKGNDPHDYKYSSAALEDYYHISPGWRDNYLAASLFKLCHVGEPDNQLIDRARAALQS